LRALSINAKLRESLRFAATLLGAARFGVQMMWRRAVSCGVVLVAVACALAVAPAGASAAQPVAFVPQAVLHGGSDSYFGDSVALSADGNTALVGVSNNGDGAGEAIVYVRSGSTWIQQAELTGSDETGRAAFGVGVALSSDGNTALIGGPQDNGSVGAAWMFVRSGSTWTQQGAKLTGSGETGYSGFGSSVALSADGSTALIGGRYDNTGFDVSGVGAAWVFVRSGSTWTQQGPKLTASDETGLGGFGGSVALSADGNTALVGGPNNGGDGSTLYAVGAAWVFVRSGSSWTQQGPKLTASDEAGSGGLGSGVALSADGNTALIGGQGDNSAWVFVRSGSSWTQRGNKLIPSDETRGSCFGSDVAFSADGHTALIGGPCDNANGDFAAGAAWVFVRSGSTWTQQGKKLTGGHGGFASSVALSSDGNTALIGSDGFGAPRSPGEAVVFTPGHAVTVAKTGGGSGTVTSSPPGISCGRSCSAPYAVRTRVTLTAKPAAGSVFSGWSGGGCSGKRTCTVALDSDRSVIAKFTLKPPKITKARIDRKHHTATFEFKAPGVKVLQCALIKPIHGNQHPKPHFTRCRSPKTSQQLKPGRYTFEVRALSPGAGPAAKRRFTI
jgi:hypothetical protein